MEHFEVIFKKYINEIDFNLNQDPYEITHEQESSISKEYYLDIPKESGESREYVIEFEKSRPDIRFLSFRPVGRGYDERNSKKEKVDSYRFFATVASLINKELRDNSEIQAIGYSAKPNDQGELIGRPLVYRNFFENVTEKGKLGRLTNFKDMGKMMGEDYFIIYSDDVNLEDLESEFN